MKVILELVSCMARTTFSTPASNSLHPYHNIPLRDCPWQPPGVSPFVGIFFINVVFLSAYSLAAMSIQSCIRAWRVFYALPRRYHNGYWPLVERSHVPTALLRSQCLPVGWEGVQDFQSSSPYFSDFLLCLRFNKLLHPSKLWIRKPHYGARGSLYSLHQVQLKWLQYKSHFEWLLRFECIYHR